MEGKGGREGGQSKGRRREVKVSGVDEREIEGTGVKKEELE